MHNNNYDISEIILCPLPYQMLSQSGKQAVFIRFQKKNIWLKALLKLLIAYTEIP